MDLGWQNADLTTVRFISALFICISSPQGTFYAGFLKWQQRASQHWVMDRLFPLIIYLIKVYRKERDMSAFFFYPRVDPKCAVYKIRPSCYV
jgi:hypothetical protein